MELKLKQQSQIHKQIRMLEHLLDYYRHLIVNLNWLMEEYKHIYLIQMIHKFNMMEYTLTVQKLKLKAVIYRYLDYYY